MPMPPPPPSEAPKSSPLSGPCRGFDLLMPTMRTSTASPCCRSIAGRSVRPFLPSSRFRCASLCACVSARASLVSRVFTRALSRAFSRFLALSKAEGLYDPLENYDTVEQQGQGAGVAAYSEPAWAGSTSPEAPPATATGTTGEERYGFDPTSVRLYGAAGNTTTTSHKAHSNAMYAGQGRPADWQGGATEPSRPPLHKANRLYGSSDNSAVVYDNSDAR